MTQQGMKLNGERAALIRAGALSPAESMAPPWLIELKAASDEMRLSRERPPGKPVGRWLGDFLDLDTPSGLLPAEEKLLFAAANGEACVLESHALFLWNALEAWRDAMPEAPEAELSFVEAIARFTETAPEPVQEVIIDATRHAIEKLRLPAYWEPKCVDEVKQFALAQRAFLARLEAEARPAQTFAHARQDERFYRLAVEAAIESLTPRPYEPLKLHHEWLNPLLRRDPLNIPAEMRAKIEAQPRVLQGFFDDLIREVKRAAAAEPDFAGSLKGDIGALRELFEEIFARYEREQWRWVDPEDAEVRVRARFLRFLALGGDDCAPVHENRLELHGAYVGEDLDLSGCTIRQPLLFIGCCFAGRIVLKDASARSLIFQRSRVEAISAESASIQGGVFLHHGFRANSGASFCYATLEGSLSAEGSTFLEGSGGALAFAGARITGDADLRKGLYEGGVFFNGAKIGGDLNCSGGLFRNRKADGSGVALGCDNAQLAQNAGLANGFSSEGAVSFSGAAIGGAVRCSMGRFANRTEDGKGAALTFDHAKASGDVNVGRGFFADGRVSFRGAHLAGDLICFGGSFRNPAPETFEGAPACAPALDLAGAQIGAVLRLGPPNGDASEKGEIAGSINLSGCRAQGYLDHSSCWPEKRVPVSKGCKRSAYISLDGFTYDGLAGAGDYDSSTRKKWLAQQPPPHLGVSFRPQPFDQLIKAYRKMGHNGRARQIAKFKESRRYRSLFSKLWHEWWRPPKIFRSRVLSPLNYLAWPFAAAARLFYRSAASVVLAVVWAFVGVGADYGYGLGRVVVFLLALWAAGALFYREVAVQGSFAPSNPVIYLNKDLEAKCGKNWTDCNGAPPELPGFSPLAYSLDVMLPGFGLGQKQEWQPIDRPGKPVIMVFPSLAWEKGYDLPSDIPHIKIEESPLAEGTVARIALAQTLLSWGALGLLLIMLIRLVRE